MATGSEKLDQIVERLKGTADPKRRFPVSARNSDGTTNCGLRAPRIAPAIC